MGISEFLLISDFQECYTLWDCGTLTLEIQFGASWDPTHPDDEAGLGSWRTASGHTDPSQPYHEGGVGRAGTGDGARGCCYN